MEELDIKKKRIINIIYYAMLVVAFYLFMNYAFWLCFPFIAAFIIAAVLQKPVEGICKKTPIKKGLASVICVFVLIFVAGFIVYLLGFKIVSELKGFFNFVMAKFENTTQLVEETEQWVTNRIAMLPHGLQNIMSSAIDSLFERVEDLLTDSATTSQPAGETAASGFQFSWLTTPISGVISTASKIPSILISVVIAIVASCFLTTDYSNVKHFIVGQFSEKKRDNLHRAKVLLKDSLSKMGKAYALIIVITFAEMSIGLSVLKLIGVYESGYILIIAFVTALVDILPILGTGTVLVPWALYSLIVGNIGMGIGIFVIYAVISVIRQIIEPKLVAGQLGLSPIVTIAAIFFGLKLFGVIGMFITPVLVVMLKLLNDEGIIKLWKPVEKQENADGQETPKAFKFPSFKKTKK